ncbi:MAG: DUF2752 domain-containing protein [Planctomycetota bacterium]|jgi:hypothetical protein
MQTNQQNKLKVFGRASSRQRLIAAVVCIAIIAFFGLFAWAGHNKTDMGRWLGYCGFKQQYSLPCPTCSMTTAVLAFAQGRILEAFYIQPTAGLLCCVLVAAAVLGLLIAVFGVYFQFLERFFAEVKIRYIVLALIVIIAAGWAVTFARALQARN